MRPSSARLRRTSASANAPSGRLDVSLPGGANRRPPGSVRTTLLAARFGPKTALKRPATTIIVVFLVCADRLSEVIMDDHRPTSSGGASLAELEAGNARRESPRGADRA